MQKKVLVLALAALGLTACGGGSDSGSTPVSSGSNDTTTTVTALDMPAAMSVVDADTSSTNLALKTNFRAARSQLSRALSDADSDYQSDPQRTHVYDDSMRSLSTVNMILCIVDQLAVGDMLNQGNYVAMVDRAKCEQGESGGDSSTQSSGRTQELWRWVVNSARASANDAQIVKTWAEESDGPGGMGMQIQTETTITEGVSNSSPFGKFTMNFKGVTGTGVVMMQGTLKTVDAATGKVAFTFYETEGGGSFSQTSAATVVMDADGSSGIAQTYLNRSSPMGTQTFGYALAYNPTHLLRGGGENVTLAQLQSVSGATETDGAICMSRTDFDANVWRYDLYWNNDGEGHVAGDRVELNSGFPFKVDLGGGTHAYGHASYWGLWLNNNNVSLDHGSTVTRMSHNSQANEASYTVFKAPGKLIRSTAKQVNVAKLRGEILQYHGKKDPGNMASSWGQWQVKYLTAADDSAAEDGFYVTGEITGWNENGLIVTPVSPYVNVTPNTGQHLPMWSESLGGRVNYLGGSSDVTFYVEEFVSGNDALFNGSDSPVTLTCYERCLKADLSNTDVNGGNHQAVFDSQSGTGTAVSYTISRTDMTLRQDGNAVALVDGVTVNEGSPYTWGMQSGEMITADVSITNPWDIFNPSLVTVSYRWETGNNAWNKYVGLLDANGAFVTFDKPIQFAYTHTTANDRNDEATFNNKTYRINYGGNGDFWGIPHEKSGERWYALFAIDDGVTMGPTGTEYVIKAREIELRLGSATGQCGSLAITQPATALPSAVSGTVSIGAMPALTAAPAVIAGEVQTTTP